MKLLDQLDAAGRTMNFAPATRECYRRWVEDYLRFHHRKRVARHESASAGASRNRE
jgi:hypothetical protein